MKPARTPQKRPRKYQKHGLHGAQRALSKRGISALDGRSAIARAVRDWRAAVASDLGGDELLSQQQRTLLDVAAQDVVLLTVADGWLRENAEKIVNRRRRALVPLVEQRLKVASHLTGLLKDLGLERKAKVIPSLVEHLRRYDQEPPGATQRIEDGGEAVPRPSRASAAVATPSGRASVGAA